MTKLKNSETTKVAIIAGNPLISETANGIEIEDYQIEAFEHAMKIVQACRERISNIFVLFDHARPKTETRDLRTIYYDPLNAGHLSRLSKRKLKKEPKYLKYLSNELTRPYREIAERYDVDFSQIQMILEGQCRPPLHNFLRNSADEEKSKIQNLFFRQDLSKLHCRAIAASAIKIATSIKPECGTLHFVGNFDEKRFTPEIIDEGIEIAKNIMGVTADVLVAILDSDEEGNFEVL